MRAAAAVAIVLVAAGATYALWPHAAHHTVDPCGAVDEAPQLSGLQAAGEATLCLVNRERTTRGLPPLRENALLSQTSREHSDEMVRVNYFEHTSPDGRSVGDRLRAVGYGRLVSASGGENIAYGVGSKATPAAIVSAWMRSPGHRADILRPAFTDIGIGIALGAPEVPRGKQRQSATYTTDFGGVVDPSLPNG